MPRTFFSFLITSAVMVLALFSSFSLYAQFVLDYSLENLKLALESSQVSNPAPFEELLFRSGLESLAIEEMSRRDGDFQMVTLLDDAVRSLRKTGDPNASLRAGVFIAEALKKKAEKRHPLLRLADSIYHFGDYLMKRWNSPSKVSVPDTTRAVSALILDEAERMETIGKLEEAERYYREFLDRFPLHSQRGLVRISLAYLLMKGRRFDEAQTLLEETQREFQDGKVTIQARGLLERVVSIEKRLAQLPALEDSIRQNPKKIFTEEGGLELALGYLATYQKERALSVLEKLSEAPDPRLRTKAIFYRDWIREWQENPDKETLPF